MSATIPSHAPKEIRKGTTKKWTLAVSVYGQDLTPAAGWTLKYYFARTEDAQTITATDNGDGTFLVTITATVAESLLTGDYTYFAEVNKTIDTVVHRYEVDRGSVEVLPSSRVTGALDGRSTAKQLLDLAKAALIEFATNRFPLDGYTFSSGDGSRSVSFSNKAALTEFIREMEGVVEGEERASDIAKGMGDSRHVGIRCRRV